MFWVAAWGVCCSFVPTLNPPSPFFSNIADDFDGDGDKKVDGADGGKGGSLSASYVVSSPPPLSSQKHQILNLLSDDPLYTSPTLSPEAPSCGTAVLLPGSWMRRWLNAVEFEQGENGVYVFGWEVTKEEFEVDEKDEHIDKVSGGVRSKSYYQPSPPLLLPHVVSFF